MNILGSVTTKPTQDGQRIVIAGPEKVGKTTLACGAPGALLVPLEMGFAGVKVPRTPMLETFEQIETLCQELIGAAKAGRIARGSSVIWDSGTALERAIHNKCLRLDPQWKAGNPAGLTMESALGGYGKAYNIANDLFGRWSRYCDELAVYGGINTIVTCHVFASLMVDPSSGEYHSWDLLLHSPKNQKTYGKREFMTQWADMIGFLHEPMYVLKGEKGQVLQKGISSNAGRQLAVDRQPGWVAGNRYSLSGLIAIPQQGGWNHLADAIYKSCGIDVYNRG